MCFFLSETHLGKEKAENLRRGLNCDHLICHESNGRSGGLLMLWRNGVRFLEKGLSKYFIDVVLDDGGEWRFTGLYGEPNWEEPNWEQKERTWESLRSLHGAMSIPT